jgi:GT2 family glycosyltransferase
MIAIAVVTHDRVHLLRQCVDRVLLRTSPATTEIVIWNNASRDDTAPYLDSIEDPRITVVHHDENILQNALAPAFARTSAQYLVTLGDDIIDAPEHWDETLMHAFDRLPSVGFLAADFADDEYDEMAELRYRIRPHAYSPFELNGIRLLRGPTGSGCAITSREIYGRVGGFRQDSRARFWSEDAAYIRDMQELGYEAAVLAELTVRHAGGLHYAKPSPHKLAFIEHQLRSARRKNAVKRALLRMPLLPRLNAHYVWFAPPEKWWEEYLERQAASYRSALALSGRA